MAENRPVEHPKPQIELMENTYQSIQDLADAKGIPFNAAAQILILNELRCIHMHFDMEMK